MTQRIPTAHSVIDAATLQAYRETEYHVFAGSSFVLRVDEESPVLARLHAAHGVSCSALLTGCNPLGVAQSDAVNTQHQLSLARELRLRGFHHVDGIGRHPTNDWHGEPSYLVLGVALADAKALGRRFDQNAILWCGCTAVPRLVLLR